MHPPAQTHEELEQTRAHAVGIAAKLRDSREAEAAHRGHLNVLVAGGSAAHALRRHFQSQMQQEQMLQQFSSGGEPDGLEDVDEGGDGAEGLQQQGQQEQEQQQPGDDEGGLEEEGGSGGEAPPPSARTSPRVTFAPGTVDPDVEALRARLEAAQAELAAQAEAAEQREATIEDLRGQVRAWAAGGRSRAAVDKCGSNRSKRVCADTLTPVSPPLMSPRRRSSRCA